MSKQALDLPRRSLFGPISGWAAGFDKHMELDDIATLLGISRARVWQIEQRALWKIRQALIEDATDIDLPTGAVAHSPPPTNMSCRSWCDRERAAGFSKL